jgi:iron complex transport system substrate-binding protein
MKQMCRTLLLALTVMLMVSCSGNKSVSSDLSEVIYEPEYASGFEIRGSKDAASVLLVTKASWQGDSTARTELFIQRNDEPIPEGFSGQVLKGDAKRIVCMSSTHVAMLDAIGDVEAVVGVSGIDYISNKYVVAHKNEIGDVGYEGNIDYELLVSLNPDLVLLYGVTGASSMEGKLKELGIPFAYVGEYLEENPLGKAEWIVALAEIVGQRERGETIYEDIPVRYNRVKNYAASQGDEPAKVMINAPYGDSWLMASTQSYMAQLIADAGGEYLYTKNTSNTSQPIDMEEAYRLASQAYVWINVGTATTMEEFLKMCPKFADTRVVKRGEIYNNNLRTNEYGGNDYWESGVVNPDLVLQDLAKIFHPYVDFGADFVYYQKLK